MAERTAEASGPAGHGRCWGLFTGRHRGAAAVTFGRGVVHGKGNTGRTLHVRCRAARRCQSRSRESLARRSLKGRDKMKKYLGVPEEAQADSEGFAEGFAEGSPGRPLGIRPPIKTLHSQLLALK